MNWFCFFCYRNYISYISFEGGLFQLLQNLVKLRLVKQRFLSEESHTWKGHPRIQFRASNFATGRVVPGKPTFPKLVLHRRSWGRTIRIIRRGKDHYTDFKRVVSWNQQEYIGCSLVQTLCFKTLGNLWIDCRRCFLRSLGSSSGVFSTMDSTPRPAPTMLCSEHQPCVSNKHGDFS